MPELPEAETVVRSLRPRILGREITGSQLFTKRVAPLGMAPLAGRFVTGLHRYGKKVAWELDRGCLLFELRMTGLLRWRRETGPHTRARFTFPHGVVCFDDIRQFGSVRWFPAPPDDLGPDPLDISLDEFQQRLAARHGMIKPLLLNQRFLRGLGNIYADEILFAAGVHPQAQANELSSQRSERLHSAMRDVLERAIAAGGSSISDYVDANGRPGRFQFEHQAYGRHGQPCSRCGTAMRRIVVAQRGTCHCPRCQRRSPET